MNGIFVIIDVPEKFFNRAKYVFSIFSNIWGLKVEISRDMNAAGSSDIVYSKTKHSLQCEKQIVIPFDERLYEKDIQCEGVRYEDLYLWAAADNKFNIDLIASTFRLIHFFDENQVPPKKRDNKGVFSVNSLPLARKELCQTPVIEHHARFLLEKLLLNKPFLENSIIPKWPEGKKCAISITHDTDTLNLGSPKQLLTNFAKLLVRRKPVFYQMVKDGLQYTGKAESNPLFGFPGWREYEYENKIRSCFYLYVSPKNVRKNLNDCKSNIFDELVDWSVLKKMVGENWEFGIHPAIHAKEEVDEFIYAKKLLENKLETNIFGLRHHYWALNWLKPYLTFRKHVNAGFRYDTSIAWKDATGFRAGTCLPFKPYDPVRDKPLDMYELPTCLMDGHLITDNGSVPEAVQSGRDIINTVKKNGGAAILDWHTETYCNKYLYSNFLLILKNLMEEFIEDSDLWFATPWEIIKWWHKRSNILSEGTKNEYA